VSVALILAAFAAGAQTDQIIYNDALQNAWENWSWAVVNLNTTPVHGGTKSTSVTAGTQPGAPATHTDRGLPGRSGCLPHTARNHFTVSVFPHGPRRSRPQRLHAPHGAKSFQRRSRADRAAARMAAVGNTQCLFHF